MSRMIWRGLTSHRKGTKKELIRNMMDSSSTMPYSYRAILPRVTSSTRMVRTAVVRKRAMVYLMEK